MKMRVVKTVSQCQRAAVKGFQLVLSSVLLRFQAIQVKVMEVCSIHREKEMEKEADSFTRKEVWIKVKVRREDPVHPLAAAVLRKRFAVTWWQSGMRLPKRKATDREGTREPQKTTARETGPSTSPPWDQGGRKQVRCIPQEGSLKNEEKRWWRQSPAGEAR